MACISTASMELIAADPGQKDSASIGTSTEVIRRVMIITPGLFQDNQKITESEENTFFIDWSKKIQSNLFLQKRSFIEQLGRTGSIDIGQIGSGKWGFHIKIWYRKEKM